MQQGRSDDGSVETLGVDLRTRVKRLGAKEKARRKKCKVRLSLTKKNKVFQKSYMKVGVGKLLRAVLVPARTWRAHAVGFGPNRKIEIEEADGSSSGPKEYNLAVLVHGSIWHLKQREAWMKQVREFLTWRQVRGPAGAVMCETRDLGIKWPRHTLLFEGQVAVDI